MNPGSDAAGFTLIEIAVVLFLMALMAILIMPSVAAFHLSRLKHEVRRLAGRATFFTIRPSANKLVLRLTFNFNAKVTLSAGSTRMLRLRPSLPTWKTAPRRSSCRPDVRLRDVTVEGDGTITRGTVSCNFYPEGYVDATVVHLIDPAGTVFTLSFSAADRPGADRPRRPHPASRAGQIMKARSIPIGTGFLSRPLSSYGERIPTFSASPTFSCWERVRVQGSGALHATAALSFTQQTPASASM